MKYQRIKTFLFIYSQALEKYKDFDQTFQEKSSLQRSVKSVEVFHTANQIFSGLSEVNSCISKQSQGGNTNYDIISVNERLAKGVYRCGPMTGSYLHARLHVLTAPHFQHS